MVPLRNWLHPPPGHFFLPYYLYEIHARPFNLPGEGCDGAIIKGSIRTDYIPARESGVPLDKPAGRDYIAIGFKIFAIDLEFMSPE